MNITYNGPYNYIAESRKESTITRETTTERRQKSKQINEKAGMKHIVRKTAM